MTDIALPRTELHDPRVTALPIRRTRRDIVEQFLHRTFLAEHGQRRTPGMERTFFPERHHLFGERADGFRLGQRGLDALMFNQAANLVRQEGFPVLGRTAEFYGFLLMSHGFVLAADSGLTTAYFFSSSVILSNIARSASAPVYNIIHVSPLTVCVGVVLRCVGIRPWPKAARCGGVVRTMRVGPTGA